MLTVITPSTGDPRVIDAIKSVPKDRVKHVVVADGPRAAEKLDRLGVKGYWPLPEAVGAHGWNGHRVYGAIPWLINTKYVMFLDEDNTIQSLLPWLEFVLLHDLEWSFCLRDIYDTQGNYIARDNFESIGLLAKDGFVDTNCYIIRRDVAVQCSTSWNKPFRLCDTEADREVFRTLIRFFPNRFKPYPEACVNYVAGSTPQSIGPGFFTPRPLPTPEVFVFHFNHPATQNLFNHKHVFDEWCPRIYDKFPNKRNGYTEFIPSNSICIFSLCHPEELPTAVIKRNDIKKILYAFESPNARHTDQWNSQYLNNFDVILTYWEHITHWPCAIACPQFCHPATPKDYVPNLSSVADVAIVLENRANSGAYKACGKTLHCLDHLRSKYAYGLAHRGISVTAYGTTWVEAHGLKVGDLSGFTREKGHAHQLLRRHSFALIVENCDAAGYISEKIFDAFCAGCIPLYYGNTSKVLQIDPGMYVDLKQFELTDETSLIRLSAFLQTVDLQRMKQSVIDNRDQVLRQVSADRFHGVLQQAIRHKIQGNMHIPTPTTILETACMPRCVFVLVGGKTQTSVYAIHADFVTQWAPKVVHKYLKSYNSFFGCSKTQQNLQPRIDGPYSVNWHVFDDALRFAHSHGQTTACCEALLFALSLAEIPIVP